MSVDFSDLNQACLDVFGQACTFTPAETGVPQTISGIIDSGVQLENATPGDGSIYARLWLDSSVDPIPAEGDEISSASTIYKIARVEQDPGGGLWLLLRKDRDF